MCVILLAKHMQKSVPLKATSVRGTVATQHKPKPVPQNPTGTSVAVTSQQRPPSGASSTPQSVVSRPPVAASSTSHPANEQILRHELQKLQKEKERLRREQEEAVRKVPLSLCVTKHLLSPVQKLCVVILCLSFIGANF